jgi:alkanesulfonate monooxygenase SsuD/methylene tetrahydromethanopterin reductase-like flavin-dependent oxidoreductase (luciferase family)
LNPVRRPAQRGPVSFGVKTSPVGVGYDDIVAVWKEADALEAIDHAWLWDHFLPLNGPKDVDVYESWTLLAALAAQTKRLKLGVMVTNNRVRYPAVLGKMASTIDVISGGRLVVGIGVGGTGRAPNLQGPPGDEHAAYGIPLVPPAEAVARLAETITILRRMWTEDAFDFDGRYYTLTGTISAPKPLQRPGPPVLVGASGTKVLRVVAEHADIWNVPGPPHASVEHALARSQVLDEQCAHVGRDPSDVLRSVQVMASYDDAAGLRAMLHRLVEAGFGHVVVGLQRPYPSHAASWLATEVFGPVRSHLGI